MQHELVSLERRITTLEDEELEVMERLEEAQEITRLPARAARAPPTSGWPRSAKPATSRPARSTRSWPGSTPSGSPRRPTGCRPTCWPSTTGSAQHKGGVGAAALRARRVRRLPAHPRQRRAGSDPQGTQRRGHPLRGVPADPGPHRTRAACELAEHQTSRHRGRRRVPRQPRPRGVRRRAQGRRHGRGDRRGRHDDRHRHQQRRGVLRPDRRAPAGRGVRARTPTSRSGWTPSSWSSRCRAAGRSSTRT